MKSLKARLVLAIVLIMPLRCTMPLAAQGPPSNAISIQRNPAILPASRHSGRPPLGDSEAIPIESSVQSNARASLEQRMSRSFRTIADPGLNVNGQTEDQYLRIVDYAGDGGGDFVSDSNCVVTAVVTDAAAFLSRNRTWVYSDFELKVENILKQDSAQPVAPGGTLIAYRTGGAIRFPSGHITNYIILNEGFPIVGARYVFFLGRWPDQISRYQISTAYELKEGVVYPLDLVSNGKTEGPGVHTMGVQYSEYEGMDEETFMSKVRAAIAAQVAKIGKK